ncbi:MAG: TIGR04372 family glycosyltransferase [Magnetococcales bacterium]|nr:TIGR04372 family glycosyltransferase [Magnetococcales bacterium]
MSRIKAFYLFPQVGRIGEIAHRIPKIRNLYPEDTHDLTLLLGGRGFDDPEVANGAVLELMCRGVRTHFVQQDEQAQTLFKQAKDEDGRTLWIQPDPAFTYQHFVQEFHAKPRTYTCCLNEDDLEKGRRLRERLGIPQNAKIVTFHIREAGYLQQMEYHNYRNASIENYFYALLHLIKKGYWIIRFGDRTMQPLKNPPEHWIDAPFHPAYEPFFEPYFIASSRFYLGMPSGPSMVAEAFGVPQLMTNYTLNAASCENEGDLFLYKKYHSHQLGRMLTYEEIVTGPLLDYHRKYLYETAEITLMENTPSEILAATWEMEARLTRSYPFMAEANVTHQWIKEIQKKAHILRQNLITDEYYPAIRFFSSYLQKGRISHEFIRMNPGFLGQRYPKVSWGFNPTTESLPGLMENFYLERMHQG